MLCTFSLSINSLRDTQVVSITWLLKLCDKHRRVYLFKSVILFSLGEFPKWNYWVVQYFYFQFFETSILLSIVAVPIYIPTNQFTIIIFKDYKAKSSPSRVNLSLTNLKVGPPIFINFVPIFQQTLIQADNLTPLLCIYLQAYLFNWIGQGAGHGEDCTSNLSEIIHLGIPHCQLKKKYQMNFQYATKQDSINQKFPSSPNFRQRKVLMTP